jgi:ornithine--oxo-acid transaminase
MKKATKIVVKTALKKEAPKAVVAEPVKVMKASHKPTDENTQKFIDKELKFTANNYKALPVMLNRAKGGYVWDVNGVKYSDFLCGYSSINQGHNHPKIIEAMVKQAKVLAHTSRAFHHDKLGEFGEFITGLLGYDKILPMNSGVEAVETACKIARKWGYTVKGVEANKANILFPTNCFWGRSIAAISGCDDESRRAHFGPFAPGFEIVKYGDAKALEARFKADPNIVAYVLEPVQGEAGVIIPPEGYLKQVRDLCTKYKVLMVCDEVQTGLGRTGTMMGYQHEEGARPDMIAIGKALSGGLMPISGVLADKNVMDVIGPGDHGSTFGGMAIACATAKAALQVILDENLVENSAKQGKKLLEILKDKCEKKSFIKEIRGRGLFIAIETNDRLKTTMVNGNDLAYILMEKERILAKATHDTCLRIAPVLGLTDAEVDKAGMKIARGVNHLANLNRDRKKDL